MDELVLKHHGRVYEGRLRLNNLPLYQANLDELEGKEIELQIIEKPQDVTLNQFGYYYGVILPYCLRQEIFGGWTKQDLDDYLKDMFLRETKIKDINGIPVEIKHVPSKARIGKRKMTSFISNVIQFLAEQDVTVPEEYDLAKTYASRGKIKARNS